MRNDMTKVIVEHPRHVAKTKHRPRPAMDDMAPAKMSLARSARERGGEKYFGDYLSPLCRYLDKQVGRPWNTVFAEITASLTGSQVLRHHLRSHLWQIVKRDTGTFHSIYSGHHGLWSQAYYVDPRNGLLKRTASLHRAKFAPKAGAADAGPIRVDQQRELKKIDGIWFEISYRAVPLPEYIDEFGKRTSARYAGAPSCVPKTNEVESRTLVTAMLRDVVTGAEIAAGPYRDEPSAWADFRKQRHPSKYAALKRQMSGSELRNRSLVNDA